MWKLSSMKQKEVTRLISPLPPLLLIVFFSTLLLYFLSNTHLFRNLELHTVDYRFAARGKKIPVSPEIKIIALDRESFAHIREPFVFWPAFIADVTQRLVDNGARVVGIDILQEIDLEKLMPGQTSKMLRAVSSGRVVLISFLQARSGEKSRDAASAREEVRYPLQKMTLIAGAENIGLATLPSDEDGITRKVPVHLTEKHLPLFPFVVAAKYLGGEIVQGKDLRYRIGGKVVQEEEGYLQINFAGPPGTFKPISFYAAYEEARKNNNAYFRDRFKDKIVLMGVTNPDLKDFQSTPFNCTRDELMSGIEIHANTINTLLQGQYLSQAGRSTFLLSLFLISLLTSLFCYYLRPFQGTSISVALGALFILIGFCLFISSGSLLNVATPSLAIPLVYGATFLYRYTTVDKKMKKIRETFGKMVSPTIEEELWRENILPFPGKGEERKVTILFSDINEFTPRCERHSPAEIMLWLNEYYTEMVDLVFQNKGTVQQFVGDEIMVMYGAPREEPHQALLAVKTAVEMVERLRKRKMEKGGSGFHEVKIGIHTGKMVVGFLGSHHRMEYTGIGESVNLAARIEGLNKALGTEILISEETYQELMKEDEETLRRSLPEVEFQKFDPLELKGFEKRIPVFQVKMRGG